MGDDVHFVDIVLFENLEDFLLKDLCVVLNWGKSLNFASRYDKAFLFEFAFNLTKRLHEDAVSDGKAMHKDNWISGLHPVDDSTFAKRE